jgi:hypothetical protein
MPKPLPITTLARLVHDLAAPLTALSMCFPEVEKKVRQKKGASWSDLQLTRSTNICAAALEETLHQLHKLQQFTELEQLKRNP